MSIFKVISVPHSESTGQHDELKFHPPYDFEDSTAFTQVYENQPIDFDVKTPTFQLSKKGRLTDQLRTARICPIFSKKALEILENGNADYFQYYKVNILHRNKAHDYFAIHLPFPRTDEMVLWKKMVFAIFDTTSYVFDKGKPKWQEIKNIQF